MSSVVVIPTGRTRPPPGLHGVHHFRGGPDLAFRNDPGLGRRTGPPGIDGAARTFSPT